MVHSSMALSNAASTRFLRKEPSVVSDVWATYSNRLSLTRHSGSWSFAVCQSQFVRSVVPFGSRSWYVFANSKSCQWIIRCTLNMVPSEHDSFYLRTCIYPRKWNGSYDILPNTSPWIARVHGCDLGTVQPLYVHIDHNLLLLLYTLYIFILLSSFCLFQFHADSEIYIMTCSRWY